MKRGNKRRLHFDTVENVRASRFRRFVLGFCCFFVLLAGVSFLIMLKYYDFDLSKMVERNQGEESTVESSEPSAVNRVGGTRNYLLICTADDGNSLRFATIVRADMDASELSLLPIPVWATVDVAGFSGTLEQQLDYGGEKQLVAALESLCGTKIDKFVRSRDSGFKSVISYVGGVEMNVPEAIDKRTGSLTAVIGAGEQTMTGDTLLKYIRCYESEPKMQAAIISAIFTQKITPSFFKKADDFYTKAINQVESNVSVLDFAQMKLSFEELLSTGEAVTAKVVE